MRASGASGAASSAGSVPICIFALASLDDVVRSRRSRLGRLCYRGPPQMGQECVSFLNFILNFPNIVRGSEPKVGPPVGRAAAAQS